MPAAEAPEAADAEAVDKRPTKQAITTEMAVRGLFNCCAAGEVTSLRQLFDDCLLVDHTVADLEDCKPIPADLRREEDGATALLVACDGGHLECAQLLLSHGCPPGKSNRRGQTPVMSCCFRGHPDILKLLLDAHASPYEGSMTDVKGAERTPLVLALDRFSNTGDDACVKQLLKDPRLRAPLSDASGSSDAAAAREQYVEAGPYYASALVTSCGSGFLECVRLLLEARVDPNFGARGRASGGEREHFFITPLQAAASTGKLDVVRALLHAGADGRPRAGAEADGEARAGGAGEMRVTTGPGAEQLCRDLGHLECAELLRANGEARALVGQHVQLHGLVGKSELNGRRGTATGYESKKERLIVAPVPLWSELGRRRDAAPILLKPANLQPLGAPPTPWLPTSKAAAVQVGVAAAAAVVAIAAAAAYAAFAPPEAAAV